MTAGRKVRTYLRHPWWVFLAVWVVTAAQGLAMVAARSHRWAGHWPSSSAVVGWAVLFGAPVAAAAAAWVIASPRRDGFRDLLAGSSRTAARVHAAGLAAVAAGSLAGYLVVTGYVAIVTTPEATHGQLNIWELLPTLGAVPAAVAVGAALGRVVPAVIAPVAAGVAPYVGYGISSYADSLADRMLFTDLFAMDDTARDYLAAPTELLILKGVVATACGVALLGWVLAARRTAYAAAIVIGLTFAGLLSIAGERTDVPTAYRAVCTDDQPVVCVDRAHDHLLSDYQERIDAALGELPGLDASRVAFVQSAELLELSRQITGEAPDLAAETLVVAPIGNGNTEPAHEIDGRMFTARFGLGLFGQPCQATRNAEGIVLYEWWLTHNGLPTDGSNFPGEAPVRSIIADDPQLAAARESFAALSRAERERWFAAHGPQILTCTASIDHG